MQAQQEYYELVKGIRQGDKKSLEILFRKLYPRLRRYANTIINSLDDAEDIVQDIFCKIWVNRNELDENKAIQTYLFVSTRNSCFNWLKHKKTENAYARIMSMVYLETSTDITPHETLIANDIETDFYSVLNELPAQCRTVFELNRFEGLKYHEIATRLNISIKTVETQMSRALAKIRFHLKRHVTATHFVFFLLSLSVSSKFWL
jgi:RNA polymerase sigma-70 factor (ECF subfamily)